MSRYKRMLWLAVTADEFELPIAIEDSAEKLASKIGISTSTVKYLEKKKCTGRNTGRRIVRIDDMSEE